MIYWVSSVMKFFSKHYRVIIVIALIAGGVLFLYFVPIGQSLFSLKIEVSPTATPDYSTWRNYTNKKFGLALKYPAEFLLKPGQTGPLAEWALYGLTSGNEIASIEISRSFQTRTNFVGASLRIGISTEATAVKECLNQPSSSGYSDAFTKRIIAGVPFSKFTRSNSAVGNNYQYTSYRAVRNGGCEVFEYVINHRDIQNYPPESGIKEFDQTMVVNSLESILDTVQFIK